MLSRLTPQAPSLGSPLSQPVVAGTTGIHNYTQLIFLEEKKFVVFNFLL